MNLLTPEELAYLVFYHGDDPDREIKKCTDKDYNITYYELLKENEDGGKYSGCYLVRKEDYETFDELMVDKVVEIIRKKRHLPKYSPYIDYGVLRKSARANSSTEILDEISRERVQEYIEDIDEEEFPEEVERLKKSAENYQETFLVISVWINPDIS